MASLSRIYEPLILETEFSSQRVPTSEAWSAWIPCAGVQQLHSNATLLVDLHVSYSVALPLTFQEHSLFACSLI